jgi:hypothetical protein
MFTIDLRPGLYFEDTALSASAPTLETAFSFVQAFSNDGTIVGTWEGHAGKRFVDVYDWYDLWFPDPQLIARITAPAGFIPSYGTCSSKVLITT